MTFPEQYRADLLETLAALDVDGINQAIEWFSEARREGKTIFVAGNGGSAASASHFVCDMVKGASYGKNERFRILSLNENIPTLTAYSNDVGYSSVFAEQLKNFANEKDLVLLISGSGNSPNVLEAAEVAKGAGCRTIGLTGRDGGKLAKLVDLNIHIKNNHMGRIEDAHMIICHMICYRFMDVKA